MAPYEITNPGGSIEHWNEEAGALWMKRMVGIYDKLVWLNPVPEEHWEYSASVELTRSLVEDNMFPLTIRGLEESMAYLSKQLMKALSITNLKKEYTGGLQALKGIDLNVEKGDFFALLGPNGAGKSTTIGIISSLVTKTSGEVKILDIDIDENHSLAKKKLGVVGQEVNFNQFEKVGDIIRNQAGYYGLSFRQARDNAKYYMRKLDIWDKRNEQARKLSGGMKRRVMVAKALVNNPDLLILDEPTAGVDIELRRSLWDFLTEINDQGTTCLLYTSPSPRDATLSRMPSSA